MKKIIKFFTESKDELLKVVWPTRKQTIEMTLAVIIVVSIVSIYLGGIDYILSRLTTWLIK